MSLTVFWLLSAQGKYEEAGALYLKAVGIQEKTLGPDHFGVALSLGSLAQVLHAQVNTVVSVGTSFSSIR